MPILRSTPMVHLENCQYLHDGLNGFILQLLLNRSSMTRMMLNLIYSSSATLPLHSPPACRTGCGKLPAMDNVMILAEHKYGNHRTAEIGIFSLPKWWSIAFPSSYKISLPTSASRRNSRRASFEMLRLYPPQEGYPTVVQRCPARGMSSSHMDGWNKSRVLLWLNSCPCILGESGAREQ